MFILASLFPTFMKIIMSRCFLIMGVSGSGKTTVASTLSKVLNIPLIEADDFHSVANIAKMRNGQALNDADRLPWLKRLAEEMAKREKTGFCFGLLCIERKLQKNTSIIDVSTLANRFFRRVF